MTHSIFDILTLDEVTNLNHRISSNVAPKVILKSYDQHTQGHKYIIKKYIKEREIFLRTKNTVLGNKTEPYYPDENSMIIPQYSYKNLSNEEKIIYNS